MKEHKSIYFYYIGYILRKNRERGNQNKKKLLYISVNSKPEELSASKTVARALITRFLQENEEFEVKEVNLYKEHIPRLEYQYFEDRALVYVQSSGGSLPWLLDPVMDRGENYIASIMKLLGIAKVEELKVDNTGTTEDERSKAITKAKDKIDDILKKIDYKGHSEK